MYCQHCGTPVESNFCPGCGRSATQGRNGKRISTGSTIIAALCIIGAIVAIASNHPRPHSGDPDTVLNPTHSAPLTPAPVYVDRVEPIATGQITVPHGGVYWKQFTVRQGMLQFRVVGQFSAAGGSGNDIEAYIADASQIPNIEYGHIAPVLYSAPRVTTGEINTPIREPGTYALIFSNRFSPFSNKFVDANIELRYQVVQ